MNACVLHAIGDLRYENVETPQAKQGEVLVHIKACGICGSDIPRVLTKGTYRFPTIPGHEFAGIIEQTGECVDKKWLGEHVAVFPLLPCHKCSACQAGKYAQCEDYNYFGSRCDGGFSEYISVPLWNLVKVPKQIPFTWASMCEPAAVAYHAMAKAAILPGENALIVGAGTIGLIVAMWCRAAGADKIIVADVNKKNLELAQQLGFTYTVNTAEEKIEDAVVRFTERRCVDAAFECAGVASSLETCLCAVGNFARVVTLGNPAANMAISQNAYWQILRKELTLLGTWNSGYGSQSSDWTRVIRGIETGQIDLEPLITHRFNLSEHEKAFTALTSRDEFTVKVLFVNI